MTMILPSKSLEEIPKELYHLWRKHKGTKIVLIVSDDHHFQVHHYRVNGDHEANFLLDKAKARALSHTTNFSTSSATMD